MLPARSLAFNITVRSCIARHCVKFVPDKATVGGYWFDVLGAIMVRVE